jgi:hypothetical protein
VDVSMLALTERPGLSEALGSRVSGAQIDRE